MGHWRTLVAFRLFGTRSSHRLVSFVGFLSVGGLALAVAVLLTVLSVVNGFERELRERVLAVLPHGTFYARQAGTDWESEKGRIASHPDVLGVAPVVEGTGLLIHANQMKGVGYRGVSVTEEPSVSILPDFIIEGSLTALDQSKFGVLLGAKLADQLDVSTGDDVTLVLPDVRFSLAGPVITTRRLTVVGLFEVGADIDKTQIVLNIRDALRLKRQREIDGLVIKVNDLFEAPRVLHDLSLSAPDYGLFATSWMRQNGTLYDAIGTQKATLFLLLLILVAVATFNVVSNLVMTVDQNRSEIAILRTMGATPGDIRVIFMLHGILVGMIGLVLGLLVGLLLAFTLSDLYLLVTQLFQLELMDEYFVHYLPVQVQWGDVVIISGVSLLISLIATIYPAGKAANAKPVEALQYDV